MSIGPRTDRILDLLEISDRIVPCLQYLVCTTRSGNWSAEMQKQGWSLSRKEALMISDALLEDLKDTMLVTMVCEEFMLTGLY
jgi:hypothetical protein